MSRASLTQHRPKSAPLLPSNPSRAQTIISAVDPHLRLPSPRSSHQARASSSVATTHDPRRLQSAQELCRRRLSQAEVLSSDFTCIVTRSRRQSSSRVAQLFDPPPSYLTFASTSPETPKSTGVDFVSSSLPPPASSSRPRRTILSLFSAIKAQTTTSIPCSDP
ncbi:hypothetical protein M0R45_006578 [Rubus argutus]|uniref:Uncharacterized protein n=1 Tax=Rubus argutus TaxID=59490 RepID=A0AAW1YRB2_RUBAR